MTLRIIGNRALKTLPGETTRPTAARVREALFNIWQGEVDGKRWLDLCGGSGSMGAEALCRGAVEVVAVEQWGKACALIQENWQGLAQPQQRIQVVRGQVPNVLKTLVGREFDCIYFDPPYASECYGPTLAAIAQHHLLAPQGQLAVEHHPQRSLPPCPPLTLHRTKVYGNTALSFFYQP